MGTPANIVDGETQDAAKVYPDHSLRQALVPWPPIEEQKTIIFRQYLTADGLPAGSNDMKVVGSAANPIDFWIPASQEADRYITHVSFVLSDAGATLSQFGNIAALANGCNFFYEHQDRVVTIHDTITTNFILCRMCLINPAFNSGVNVLRLPNIVGNSEAFVPVFPACEIVRPFGIKLDMGSPQRLVMQIRDDITAIDGFNAIAYGFDRLE